jgi:hypothetical protein
LPLVLVLGWLGAPRAAALRASPAERNAALCRELQDTGIEAAAKDVHWVDTPRTALASLTEHAHAVVLGHAKNTRADVYLVDARLSPEGALLELGGAWNLTRTSAVAEEGLVAANGRAAWTLGGEGKVYRIEFADVGHEARPTGETWTRVATAQHAVTNLQHTGTLGGVGRRSFKLDPPAASVALSTEESHLRIVADDHVIEIPYARGGAIVGERFLREEDRELASPGNLVTWAVDRVRELSWFGDERMQWTKAVAYAALDRVDRVVGTVRAAPEPETNAESLGDTPVVAAPADPETGWPPPPATPLVTPALPDEGKWFSLESDPYVHGNAGAPPPLVTTYLRAEGSRPDSRVVVVAWDARQVELDAVPGTEEPQSATGANGTGMIPREPRRMKRLLGAFNGGFQSTHGDFGMQVDGEVLVPPKPFAATIAATRDGATVFGTWPRELDVPPDFLSFRQNLTPLVEGGRFNPWGREWWGGVPHDWEDETRTVRSGVCLAKSGFVAYFYGTKIDHTRLGRAMIAVGCEYGIHLDMNQGHTGIELYRVYEDGTLPPLPGKLDGHWQAEAPVLGLPGYTFRGRKLTRNMQLMHFPRYIRRGARDYFYLMLRPTLPGAPLSFPGAAPGEGVWANDGLPEEPFPRALATTSLRPDPARPESKVRALKLDPSVVRIARSDDGAHGSLLAASRSGAVHDERRGAGSASASLAPTSDVTLWFDGGHVVLASAAPSAGATAFLAGRRAADRAKAGACVDEDGMVLFAEVATAPDPARDGALLARVFDAARCKERMYLTTPLALTIADQHDLSGHPAPVSHDAVRLVRETLPRARRVFADTKVLPPAEWMPLQRQTRYFPKPEPPASSASADAKTDVGPEGAGSAEAP